MDPRIASRRIEQLERAVAALMTRVANLPARFTTGRRGGGSTDKWLAVDSNRTCGEVYKAYIFNFTATSFDTTATSFAAADLGEIGAEVTLLNTQEGDNSLSHYITEGTQVIYLVRGSKMPFKDDQGRDCYLFTGKDFEECAT